MSFEEYLEDYTEKEMEEINKFYNNLSCGKVSLDERYPPLSRFIKINKNDVFLATVAASYNKNAIWCTIPFFDSTFIPLIPRANKQRWDELYNSMYGFTSNKLDEIIDFIKDTGRMQFVLKSKPILYKNLEFLEHIFYELKPPLVPSIPFELFIEENKLNEYTIEFDIASKFLKKILYRLYYIYGGVSDIEYITQRINDYEFDYIALKILGYNKIADEIFVLMLSDPLQALDLFSILGSIIAVPSFDPLKLTYCYDLDFLQKYPTISSTEKSYHINEIGKFILKKLVHYPESLDGCINIIQYYDDYDLRKILKSLNEGIKKRNINVIESKKEELNEIMDDIWKESKKINFISKSIRYGIMACFGLIGSLASQIGSIEGILAGLGFSLVGDIIGMKLSDKISRFLHPNYLITIYDFRQKYRID